MYFVKATHFITYFEIQMLQFIKFDVRNLLFVIPYSIEIKLHQADNDVWWKITKHDSIQHKNQAKLCVEGCQPLLEQKSGVFEVSLYLFTYYVWLLQFSVMERFVNDILWCDLLKCYQGDKPQNQPILCIFIIKMFWNALYVLYILLEIVWVHAMGTLWWIDFIRL